jgi:hypothetical protein
MNKVIAIFFILVVTVFKSNAVESGNFETLHSLIREIRLKNFVNKSKGEIIDIFMDSLSVTFGLNYTLSYSNSWLTIGTDKGTTKYACNIEEDVSEILSFLDTYSNKIDSILKSYRIKSDLEYYMCDYLLSKIDKSTNSRVVTSQLLGKSAPSEYDFAYIKDANNNYVISSVKTNICSVQETSVKIGDIIESIDSIPSRYLTNNLVYSLLFDKDSVDLTLLSSEGLRHVRLKSTPIEQNKTISVSEINKKTLYVKIYNLFGNTICKEILEKIHDKRYRRLILDLRNNSGGRMGEIIDFLSLFLNYRLPIVEVESPNKEYKDIYWSNQNRPVEIPELYILINHSTASGANIIAEVLRNECNAVIIGEKSYGVNEIHATIPLYPKKYFANILVGSFSVIGIHASLNLGISPDHYIMDCYQDGDSILNFSISAHFQIKN